ncbi:MAG TPA: hypothetical protein VNJ04_16060, partial [Gemmatimonadaceae bacterium]|nr:hypothetical protein [Gemmatimonadaceae bacterium]
MNSHGRETILAIHALTRKSPTTNYRSLAAKLGLSLGAIQDRLLYVEHLGLVPPRPRGQRNT